MGFGGLWAVSPDYANMGRLLEEQNASILGIDIALSNLMPPARDAGAAPSAFAKELEDTYHQSIKRDFNARLWYLQGDYGRTYAELRASQDALQATYRRILEGYLDDTWVLLEEIAPLVVRTRDADARHLLQLGYRDLEVARQFHQRAYNIKPTLFNNQILFYGDGIKRIRRARRYALLALIEAKIPAAEKTRYQLVTLDDFRKAAESDSYKVSSFERVSNMLTNLIGRQLVPPEIKAERNAKPVRLVLLEVHRDNYNAMVPDRISVWQRLLADLKADEGFAKRIIPTGEEKPAPAKP